MTAALFARAWFTALFASSWLFFGGVAAAQEERPPGLLDNIFGGNQSAQQPARSGQPSAADISVRLDRMESAIRQLTGAVEQLQFRNQQLEQQLQRMQGDAGAAPASAAAATAARPPAAARPLVNTQPMLPAPAAPATPGRRSDVFDPAQQPNAPGAPQPLGSIIVPEPAAQAGVGARGRAAGAPLDLSTMSGGQQPAQSGVQGDGILAQTPEGRGAQMAAVAPPSASPRDEFDLGLGYVKRKDYALAEETFRAFLKKHASDRLTAEAQFWLAESLFQRQRYRDAAESFLTVTTKYDTSAKAPDALLRLGQSLAALGEKQTACEAWGEIGRKYARASASVKTTVAAEQKRVRC